MDTWPKRINLHVALYRAWVFEKVDESFKNKVYNCGLKG